MKTVPCPNIRHRRHYVTCILQTQDPADRAVLLDLADGVVEAGQAYRRAARAGRLYTIQPMVIPQAEKALLSKVYDKRMVAANGSGRVTYDDLRDSLAICPYCNSGEVYELDHFLPKGKFPEYNVIPINLVPICHPCNHIKLERAPEGRREYFVHPYFDMLPDDVQWLFADLKRSSDGPVLTYRVDLDATVHGPLADRLAYQFRQLELDRRFKERSATMLVELEAEIDEHLAAFDKDQMANHFAELADRSLRLHGNTIETAAYLAASENEEYCAGGFRS